MSSQATPEQVAAAKVGHIPQEAQNFEAILTAAHTSGLAAYRASPENQAKEFPVNAAAKAAMAKIMEAIQNLEEVPPRATAMMLTAGIAGASWGNKRRVITHTNMPIGKITGTSGVVRAMAMASTSVNSSPGQETD